MKKETNLKYIFLSALIVIFLTVLLVKFTSVDLKINNYFESLQSENIILLAEGVSFLVSPSFTIILSLLVIALLYKKGNHLIFYISSVIAGLGLQLVLKNTFERIRPVNPFESGFSFPSGHALESTMVYGSLALIFWKTSKKFSCILLAFPILISFSRICLGVHWFTDVLGGLSIGVLWLISVYIYFFKSSS